MKKIIALLAAVILLTTCCLAENYMEQIPQEVFVRQNFMTNDSCPAVCISSILPDSSLTYQAYQPNPWYVRFSKPEGAIPMSFDTRSASFYVEEPYNGVVYTYQLLSSAAFETFVANAENDGYILRYDSTVAAYIKPGSTSTGYALIAAPQAGKTAKLEIIVTVYGMSRASQGDREETVIELLTAEIDRVMSEMVFEQRDTFWSKDQYDGLIAQYVEDNLTMIWSFPELTIQNEKAKPYVYELDKSNFNLMANFASGSVKLEGSLNTYSHVVYTQKDEPQNINAMTLADGSEYLVYAPEKNNENGLKYVYISRLLCEKVGFAKQNLYLTFLVDAKNIVWKDMEDFTAFMNQLLSGRIQWQGDYEVIGAEIVATPIPVPATPVPTAIPTPITTAAPTPVPTAVPTPVPTEVPTPVPTAEPTVAPVTSDAWVCPECGNENSKGLFCTECGTKKPEAEKPVMEDNSWFCPECGTKCTGKFCPECGTKKPVAEAPATPTPVPTAWFCPECGNKNTTAFCTECGTKRPY